jgi:ribulose-5-phosphate 4-epimerase/fuculose-1-phosphate aldolase
MDINLDKSISVLQFPLRSVLLLLVVAGTAVAGLEGQQTRIAIPAASPQTIEGLVLANRILANEGVVDGLGHVSLRHNEKDDRFVLSRALAPAVVTAQDLLEYDLDGNSVDGQARSHYGERFIHAAIYRARREVKAIVHCHTPSVLPFANSNVQMRPIYQMSDFLAAGAPVFEIRNVQGARGMLVNNLQLGQALAGTLADKAVVLMRGHGAVVVGESILEAVSRAVYLDISAKIQAQSIAFGGPVRYREPEDLPAAAGNPYQRVWEHLKQRLPNR